VLSFSDIVEDTFNGKKLELPVDNTKIFVLYEKG
jgi:hypothetical protein